MSVEPYRRVLALPGVRALMLVGIFARIPVNAAGLTLTMYVVHELRLGWFQAGLVGAGATLGIAIGAPVAGRFIDRYGLRPVIGVTTVVQLAFWLSASFLPYAALLVGALLSGLFAIPVMGLMRQCISVMVPGEQRRPAYSLDSVLAEISYMIGPAVAVAASASLGSHWTMAAVGIGLVGAGTAMYRLNPPTRDPSAGPAAVAEVPPRRREWLGPAVFALLAASAAGTFVVTATELSMVAILEDAGATSWSGLVIGLWCAWSLIGGLVYGTLKKGASPFVVVGLMALTTAPVGFVGDWRFLALALIPAGLLCAPSMASVVDALSHRVPDAGRGEAMGLQSTALTLGLAVGGPLSGWVIDEAGAGWGFLLAGAVGLLLAGVGALLWRVVPTRGALAAKAA
ncbi:putative MFS family arabinose efflux permease [Actinocorallia herbida]|uniref:Putative MFS family arabinose efflux permease n=1 Tax=Actinocorallia herbida TaxID=58109 RepID=A0A3N1D519_9ACTN|nr:MFS transporter [Actinocorallia herbida]ROO88178.1 putative MFS family arabinose efflux permease [Actinocorallia herbida]